MGSVTTILQSDNIHRTKMAEYDAAVMIQKSKNTLEAANQRLNDFSKSLNNMRIMEAAGTEYGEQIRQTAYKLNESITKRSNQDMEEAARLGSLLAQASAMGVGGSSVELLNQTVELQASVARGLTEDTRDAAAIGFADRSAQGMVNASNALDLSRTFGNFDYTKHIAPKELNNKWIKLAGVAVAAYFGGPQAGEAVADAVVGEWQAKNGNFTGAAQSFDSAIQNGVGAYKNWADTRGGNGTPAQAVEKETIKVDWGQLDGDGFGSDFGWFNMGY